MSDNNLATKQDLSTFYNNILPYLGGGMKLAGPVGMIISYMGTTAPSGYLACDGSWYDIGLYPKLANWMMNEFGSYSYFALSGETVQSGKFKVPDLRGEFLRGTGTNSHTNQGSGAAVGEHQNATTHLFYQTQVSNRLFYTAYSDPYNPKPLNVDSKGNFPLAGDSASALGSTINNRDIFGYGTADYTSRPTNTSVLYCIKYEEYEGDGRGVQYSTEEQIIGTWIDGKTLYQKTIDFGALPNTTTKRVTHGITNIDNMASINAIAKASSSSTYTSLPSVSTADATRQLQIYIEGANIVLISAIDFSIYTECYITLQYTKTT